MLGLGQKVEDILITLDSRVHPIRPLERNRSMFVDVARDMVSSHVGRARIQPKTVEASLKL